MEVASGAAGCFAAFASLRWWVTRRLQHISSGEQRRAVCPLSQPIWRGAEQASSRKDITISQQLLRLKSGKQVFGQILRPTETPATRACVFLHGYMAHGEMTLPAMSQIASEGCVVVIPDLPNHGRSDGVLAYMPDWWAWMDEIWEEIELLLSSACTEEERRLPLFVSGISLGGGVAACLCLQRPDYFKGALLFAPMLTISDNLKPPWVVTKFLKHVLAPLLPTWPITPTKDLEDFDYRIPGHGRQWMAKNPLSMQGHPPRLATARELGLEYPDWLEEHLGDFRSPFIIFHGSADKITDPVTSQQLFDQAASSDKTLKLVDGAYHSEVISCLPGDIAFSPEQLATTASCLKEMTAWMKQRS